MLGNKPKFVYQNCVKRTFEVFSQFNFCILWDKIEVCNLEIQTVYNCYK